MVYVDWESRIPVQSASTRHRAERSSLMAVMYLSQCFPMKGPMTLRICRDSVLPMGIPESSSVQVKTPERRTLRTPAVSQRRVLPFAETGTRGFSGVTSHVMLYLYAGAPNGSSPCT